MGRPTSLETAYSVYRQSIGEEPKKGPPVEPEKDPAAVELGRKGGKKGGKATAAKRTAAERSEAARKAVTARWEKERAKAD